MREGFIEECIDRFGELSVVVVEVVVRHMPVHDARETLDRVLVRSIGRHSVRFSNCFSILALRYRALSKNRLVVRVSAQVLLMRSPVIRSCRSCSRLFVRDRMDQTNYRVKGKISEMEILGKLKDSKYIILEIEYITEPL